MRVLAICNQKGGCGKTITSINLAASLSFLGKKVLLVDLDPQAHSTVGLGVKSEELEKSLFDALNPESSNRPSLQEIVIQIEKNLWLAPSQIVLTALEQQLSGVPKREEYLRSCLLTVQKNYDFVLIDCPPNLGILTFNALRAAGEAVITIEPSSFSVHGLEKVNETLNVLRERIQHVILVHALLTMLDNRNKFSRDVVDQVRAIYGDRVFRTVIRNNIRLREAAQIGRPITRFDRHSTGFHDYLSLASEIIERGVKQQAEDARLLQAEEQRLAKLLSSKKAQPWKDASVADEKAGTLQSGKTSAEDEYLVAGQESGTEASEEIDLVSDSVKGGARQAPIESVADQIDTLEVGRLASSKEVSPEVVSDLAGELQEASPPLVGEKPSPAGEETKESVTQAPTISPLLPIKGIRKYPLKVSGGYLFICKCPTAKSVQLVGDFTNWIAVNMNSPGGKSGFWTRIFSLTPGRHKYKFIVDGEWLNDINNSKYQRNPYGGIDSIVEVP